LVWEWKQIKKKRKQILGAYACIAMRGVRAGLLCKHKAGEIVKNDLKSKRPLMKLLHSWQTKLCTETAL
jgi:hypothetical protein